MSLREAITKAQAWRDLWNMDIHVLNELVDDDEEFNLNYFCVLDINLYIYIHHDYTKNHKVYYTAYNYTDFRYSFL